MAHVLRARSATYSLSSEPLYINRQLIKCVGPDGSLVSSSRRVRPEEIAVGASDINSEETPCVDPPCEDA